MSTTNPSQPSQFISKHVLELTERINAENQRHTEAIKQLDEELRKIVGEQSGSDPVHASDSQITDSNALRATQTGDSNENATPRFTNPDIPKSVLPYADFFEDLNSVNFTKDVHTLRGSVKYRGDIISPIDVKWDAES
jgi:hypothetical protein